MQVGSSDSPFSETTTTTFEWKLTGLKKIFESSKGETKSKVTRSIQFGGGKWQILFYPNSGTEGGTHISLYLSCEPTTDEKRRSMNNKWVRDGLFKFSFELRNVSKTVLFNSKEACDHSFSWKTANWGWAQFARRDMVYYQANTVRIADAFTIICVITSSPFTPSPPALLPIQSVPCELMDSVGDLLNEPLYSDVEFILTSSNGKKRKRIYAMKRLLVRTEYFDIMLNNGFIESENDPMITLKDNEPIPLFPRHNADDSDYEMDEADSDSESDSGSEMEDLNAHSTIRRDGTPSIGEITAEMGSSDKEEHSTITNTEGEEERETPENHAAASGTSAAISVPNPEADVVSITSWPSTMANNDSDASITSLLTPSSEKGKEKENQDATLKVESEPKRASVSIPGPPKVKIVVRDVAYRTYYAMLHYLYTDNIKFAPLSSTFIESKPTTARNSPTPGTNGALQTPATAAPPSAKPVDNSGQQNAALQVPTGGRVPPDPPGPPGPPNRKEWLKEWRSTHVDDVVEPCSAKAMYKLADKLDLIDLKNRAFKHIVKSTTIHNVPHEMFSSFSAKFDDVRKVQVEYFLAHWSEIRGSEGMKNVWQQIRVGRHPGFEEVWPLIAMNLEFKPSPQPEDSSDERDGVHDS